jgi:hypothetical protein
MDLFTNKSVNDWTVEILAKVGAIKSGDGRSFYVESEENFRRLIRHWNGNGPPLVEKSGSVALKSEGKSLNMTTRDYCMNYHPDGLCYSGGGRDILTCWNGNRYCKRFEFIPQYIKSLQ